VIRARIVVPLQSASYLTQLPWQVFLEKMSTADILNDEGDFDALLQAFIRDPNGPRPDWALDPNRSIDEQLNETPFFMTQLPDNMEDNIQLQALQALLYDGTPEENATNFKEQGNEAFKSGRSGYQDALVFYTKGIDQKPNDPLLRAQLYNNRSAVHLALKNFGFAARDAAMSISSDQSNVKAFWRAAKASLALEKISESEAFCQKGLKVFPENSDLSNLSKEIQTTKVRLEEEKERIEVGKAEASKIQRAMLQRGVRYHADAEKLALIEIGPGLLGSDAPRATLDKRTNRLLLPIVFMYPPLSQFDFIEAASEDTSFIDHLTEMFAQPAPWDPEILYKSPLAMSAYILPINEAILDDESKEKKSIYRVSLRTPIGRLLGSVIKCYEIGIMAVYILPNMEEKKRFEHKFKDYRILDI
jgi:tetratricopeptide (TPR) repeat protein